MTRATIFATISALATAVVNECADQCAVTEYVSADILCVDCPAGKKQDGLTARDTEQTEADCNMCVENFYGDGTTCTACPVGRTGSGAADTDCGKCPTTHWGGADGSSGDCEACPAGKANLQEGTTADDCNTCVVNFYGDGTTCTACPVGRTGSGTAASDCGACAAGKFGGADGSDGDCVDVCSALPTDLTAADLDGATVGSLQCDETATIEVTSAVLTALQGAVVSGSTNASDDTDVSFTGCENQADGDTCEVGDSGYQLTCNTADDSYTLAATATSSTSAIAPVLAVLLGVSSL